MKVLVTGANGQLGRCFTDAYSEEYELIALGSQALDITDETLVKKSIDHHKPDVVINAAAYTAVDKAEEQPDQAFLANAQGARNLAVACAEQDIDLIHISTDYVFDGLSKIPYSIFDSPSPINIYGKSKLAGELLVLAHHPTARIIRTSWVYSEYGNNFLKTMLKLAKEGRAQIQVVNDQYGCPTYAGNLARAIGYLIENKPSERLYHYTDGKEMSWYEFTQEIFATIDTDVIVKPNLQPSSSLQYASPTRRPQFSVLQNSFVVENKVSLQDVVRKI